MRGIELGSDYVDSILKGAFNVESVVETKTEKLEEGKKAKEEPKSEEKEEVNEEEVVEHSCPLCESKLEAPISEERLAEHVQYIMGVINEAFDTEDELVEETKEETKEE